MRGRSTEGRFISEPMDVNIATITIDRSAAIEAALQTFQPKNAMHDSGVGLSLPGQARHLPAAKNGADRLAAPDLFRDAVQTQRCPIGISVLSDAVSGRGNGVTLTQEVGRESSCTR